jgi:mannose-1-phosphate guanylyltransferase
VRSHGLPNAHWCIVVADDHGPEWAPVTNVEESPAPAQYSRLGESSTLLQRALRRASRIAPAPHVMVTALDEYRDHWESALWCVRPQNRFVGDNRAASLLTAAAALLSITTASPSSIVTILPARCYVAREDVLRLALEHVLSMLPRVSEGVATLGMVDMNEGIDEDYLVCARAGTGPGLIVDGFARRPTAWIARRLKNQGAMVASGIMMGYAGAFAAHISEHWPGLTLKLTQLAATASAAGEECEVPMALQAGVPKHVLRSLRWNPPSFPQRAFCVRGCGWSGLKSAQAVERMSTWISTPNVLDAV